MYLLAAARIGYLGGKLEGFCLKYQPSMSYGKAVQ
jgi:hypothetical protein